MSSRGSLGPGKGHCNICVSLTITILELLSSSRSGPKSDRVQIVLLVIIVMVVVKENPKVQVSYVA